MGCGGHYESDDQTIVAVGPDHEGDWPCGTVLHVCGAAGCIYGERRDGCPGCGLDVIDLSEAGINLVCGDQASVCEVTIHAYERPPDLEDTPQDD